MTPARQSQAEPNGADGQIYGVRASTIAYMVNRVGLPSVIVLGVFAAALWYFPKYLERQSAAVEKMADAFKDIAEAEQEIKGVVVGVKEAVSEVRQWAEDTRAFQQQVVEEHEIAARERAQMLDDHKRIMAELIGKQ